MYAKVITSLLLRIVPAFWIKTIWFARVEGVHRLLCLKNSSNVSGQYVLFSAAAQYSSFHPCSIISVHNQRSSPNSSKKQRQCYAAMYQHRHETRPVPTDRYQCISFLSTQHRAHMISFLIILHQLIVNHNFKRC